MDIRKNIRENPEIAGVFIVLNGLLLVLEVFGILATLVTGDPTPASLFTCLWFVFIVVQLLAVAAIKIVDKA